MKHLLACFLIFASAAVFAAVTISPSAKTFEKSGGAASIVVEGDGDWTAASDSDWIDIRQGTSGSGAGSCVYLVSANTTADTRIGHISFGANIYTVTQHGYAASISPSGASLQRNGGSGTISVTVDAGITWTATANDNWITVSPSSGTSAGTVVYSVAAYDGVVARTGTITVAGQEFSITQNGIDVVVQPESVTRESAADIINVEVSALSTTSWTAVPNAPWITILNDASGNGNYSLLLAIDANPSYARREGTVAIGSATLTVSQAGQSIAALSITPAETEVESSGAYGNIAVYATPDAPWMAESLMPWLTISEGAAGAGNGIVRYVASANPTLEEREGQIVVTPPHKVADPDLHRGLVLWIKDKTNIEGNESRQSSVSLNTMLDGSQAITFSGTDIPKRDSFDFSFAVSFKVGELGCVNRLFSLGSRDFYLDIENKLHCDYLDYPQLIGWSIDSPNEWYTIMITHEMADPNFGRCRIFAGKRNSKLNFVYSYTPSRMLPLDVNEKNSLSYIKLGQTGFPSTGFLRNGQFANVRLWTRALTDTECEQVDLLQDAPMTDDDRPLGAPNGVAWDYFPLDGNAYRTTHTNATALVKDTSLSGWADSVDRFEEPRSAIVSTGNGSVTISNFENMFSGSYTLNNGKTLGAAKGNYSYKYKDTSSDYNYYYPYPAAANSDSEINATYSAWIKIDSYPASGTVTILARSVAKYCNGSKPTYGGGKEVEPQSKNVSLSVALTTAGKLKLSGTGVTTTTFSTVVPLNEWHMVTMVGTSEKSIQVYLDDTEIGNVASTMTLGYLPPVDQRYCYNYSGNISGSVVPCDATFTLGGWDGAADGLTFYHAALTSAQVREIYNRQKPQKVIHTVTQGVQVPQLSKSGDTAPAEGTTQSVALTLAQNVQWTAQSNADWLTITSGTQGAGSANIAYTVAANPAVTSRTGTLTIAGKTLTVTQEGLWADVSCEDTSFGVTSDSGFILVNTEGAGQWTATTDASWIHLLDTAGNGAGSVLFVIDDYTTTTQSRSGTITVAGKKVVISQQGYELSIDPAVANIGSNAGAGQFGVAAPIDAVWEAIADCDWIRIIGARTGIGDGIIQYEVLDNLTGETRTGRIVVSGKAYTITQRTTLNLNATTVGSGNVAGTGTYSQGTQVTLTAVPASGYVFTHWSGDAVGVSNVVEVAMDCEKNVVAHFIPETAAERLATEKAAQGGFYTRDQIHAMELGNLLFDVDSNTGKARIGVKLMETDSLSNPDWKPVSVSKGDLDVGADGSVGISTPATGNAKFYKVVGGGGDE